MKTVPLDQYGYLPYSVKWADDILKMGEIVRYGDNGYAVVIDTDRGAGPFETEYKFKSVKISRWWLTRKIQLWAIKKAFK